MQKKRAYYDEEEDAQICSSSDELITMAMINNRRQGHYNEMSKPSSPSLSEGTNCVQRGGNSSHYYKHNNSNIINANNSSSANNTAMTSLHLLPPVNMDASQNKTVAPHHPLGSINNMDPPSNNNYIGTHVIRKASKIYWPNHDNSDSVFANKNRRNNDSDVADAGYRNEGQTKDVYNDNANNKVGINSNRSDDGSSSSNRQHTNIIMNSSRDEINTEKDKDKDLVTGKPQSMRKTPFFYCKTLGWDPTLNKFHIQLDTFDVNSKDDNRSHVSSAAGKSSMTSINITSEKTLSIGSNKQHEQQQQQTVSSHNKERETGTPQSHITDTAETTTKNNGQSETSTEKAASTGTLPQENESQDSQILGTGANRNSPIVQQITMDPTKISSNSTTSTVEMEVHPLSRIQGNAMTVERESVEVAKVETNRSSRDSTESTSERRSLLDDAETIPCSDKGDDSDKSPAAIRDDDDEHALIIDTEANDEGRPSENDNNQEEEIESSDIASETAKEKDNTLRDPLADDDGKSVGRSSPEEDEDFRCRVCKKIFASHEAVTAHFTSQHFRPVGDSILEPESPFPVNNADGNGFMDDDEEPPEQIPVETQLIEYPETTLSTLLRSNSSDNREAGNNPGSSNQLPTAGLGPSHAMRQFLPPGRGGYLPPRMPNQFVVPTSDTRPMGPPGMLRPSGFPSALHRALVEQGHYQGGPPPRPALRPMPAAQIRGGLPGQTIPNRPPLTRVPPAIQMANAPPPNSQSILRPEAPSPQNLTDTITNKIQDKRVSQSVIVRQIEQIKAQPTPNNPQHQQELAGQHNYLVHFHHKLEQEILKLQSQLQQHHLQRQQMLQMNAQNIQQQQLRQHQLQQSRNQQQVLLDNAAIRNQAVETLNANGKRSAVSTSDLGGMTANDPKQPRLHASHPFLDDRNRARDNLTRFSNGITLRPIAPSEHPSPSVISHQIVRPGMNSGGSTGSRHSSGSTSPHIPSPVAQRLAHSGITLTSTSPIPLTPLSPPANPNLSPISDNSLSPRGSPRIQVGQLIQNVMTSCNVPNTVGNSASSAQQRSNFVPPRPPMMQARPNNDINNIKNAVVTLSQTERPGRPPTVDLTDDDVQTHTAQMRKTGGGAVTQDQIQLHEASQQQRRGMTIPGTSQFSIRPVNSPQGPPAPSPPRPMQGPNNQSEHSNVIAHRQGAAGPSHPAFRPPHPQQPGVVVRRASPGTLPHARPNLANQVTPPPSRPTMAIRERTPNPSTVSVRHHPSQLQPQSSEEQFKNMVIPLLHVDRLDPARVRALHDIGVSSLLPLQDGYARFCVPLLRLRPDIALGHFPHDSAIEVGGSIPLTAYEQLQSRQQQMRRTPTSNVPVPSHAAAPPSHPHPPSVISPPMGTTCTDRSCTELMAQRPSPTSVIQHNMTHPTNQISVRPIMHQTQAHQISNANAHASQFQSQQQQQRSSSSHHESFLGGSGSQFGGTRN